MELSEEISAEGWVLTGAMKRAGGGAQQEAASVERMTRQLEADGVSSHSFQGLQRRRAGQRPVWPK